MFPDFITNIICIAIGRVYPAFCTYKAIKNDEKEAFTQWLMYWVCFAIYSTGEYLTDIFLGFWFPFYNEIKIALLISFLFGKASGAEWVYTHILCPHLDENEAVIESYIEKAKFYSIATFQYVGKEVITRFNMLTRSLLTQIHQIILNQLRENLLTGDPNSNFNPLTPSLSSASVSTASDYSTPPEPAPISEECEKFTLIREENGEYNLVQMDTMEVLPEPPTIEQVTRKRGRPRKQK